MSEVSIIIPCYNQGYYLSYALESILAQTFTDWEAIIIDDGSNDNTQFVTTQFDDPRIQYVYQKNQGLATSRNNGIKRAKGDYLSFLDADDEWSPEFLSCCLHELKKCQNWVGVYTQNHFIDEKSSFLPQIGGQVVSPAKFRSRLLEGGFFVVHAVMIKKSVVENVGMFDPNLAGKGVEDWDLWLRISEKYIMGGIKKPLAYYRVYLGSMSTNTKDMFDNRIAVIKKHFGVLDLSKPSTQEIQRIYALVYRWSAFEYIQYGETNRAWSLLKQASILYPELLQRSDTYGEFLYKDQPRGCRGAFDLSVVSANADELFQQLDLMFLNEVSLLGHWHYKAYATAHLLLCKLNEQGNNNKIARLHWIKAIKYDPMILFSIDGIWGLLKLNLPKVFFQWIQTGKRLLDHLIYEGG